MSDPVASKMSPLKTVKSLQHKCSQKGMASFCLDVVPIGEYSKVFRKKLPRFFVGLFVFVFVFFIMHSKSGTRIFSFVVNSI